MGIRNGVMAAAMLATFIVTGVLAGLHSRSARADLRVPTWMSILGCVSLSTLALMFGPLFFLPGIAGIVAVAFMFHPDGRSRVTALVGVTAAIVVPTVLEWLGVLPASYEFREGAIVILPRMVNFPPGLTSVYLLIDALTLVWLPGLLVARVNSAVRNLESKQAVQLWQLEQLVSAPPNR